MHVGRVMFIRLSTCFIPECISTDIDSGDLHEQVGEFNSCAWRPHKILLYLKYKSRFIASENGLSYKRLVQEMKYRCN
jgi:hypothetical protein